MSGDATVSTLGIYVVKGVKAADDVYYYATDYPDTWIMVPAATVFVPCEVHRPPEDRESWHAIGEYGDNDYGIWITAATMAKHSKRIISALRTEVGRQRREKEQWELWYRQERDKAAEKSPEAVLPDLERQGIIAEIRHQLDKLEGA